MSGLGYGLVEDGWVPAAMAGLRLQLVYETGGRLRPLERKLEGREGANVDAICGFNRRVRAWFPRSR